MPQSQLSGRLSFFDRIRGDTPSGKKIEAFFFLGDVVGDITPAAEIIDAQWLSCRELIVYNLSGITAEIIRKLFQKKLI